MTRKIYSGVGELPRGEASDHLITGCLVCVGGAFRGVYTSGVLDCLMEHDINLSCTLGVSAGALIGAQYVSGQIGRSGRFNLTYRHDPNYVGPMAYPKNKGLIGFDYMFNGLDKTEPLNKERLFDSAKRFVVVATNVETGEAEFFEAGKCEDIFTAIQASASMPFMSKPVRMGEQGYLDGGIADKVPFDWALKEGFDKIIVVKTREDGFRNDLTRQHMKYVTDMIYRKQPEFAGKLKTMNARFNQQCDELDELTRSGRIFTIAPSEPVRVGRIEPDMEKLGALYHLGYEDAMASMEALRQYLER